MRKLREELEMTKSKLEKTQAELGTSNFQKVRAKSKKYRNAFDPRTSVLLL